MRVRHHEPKAAPIRIGKPLRQPLSVTLSSPAVPKLLAIVFAPLDQLDEYVFEIRLLLSEVLDDQSIIRK